MTYATTTETWFLTTSSSSIGWFYGLFKHISNPYCGRGPVVFNGNFLLLQVPNKYREVKCCSVYMIETLMNGTYFIDLVEVWSNIPIYDVDICMWYEFKSNLYMSANLSHMCYLDVVPIVNGKWIDLGEVTFHN